jgi:hypothetical protein
MPETLSAMLHLLVFAYWLGGDVGAFVASFTLSDPKQSPAARLAAANILNQVDMAPRSALILTLPTGLTLAQQRGWLDLPNEALVVIWIASLSWLAALWWGHATRRPSPWWRVTDLALRIALIAGLTLAAWLVTFKFLQIKFVCLALAAALGLAIRFAIAPMGPAIVRLASLDVPAGTDHSIAQSLRIARPLVACIWICLVIAAWAGVAKPA